MTGWNPLSFTVEGLREFLHRLDRRVSDLERGGNWQFDNELVPEEVIRAGGAPHLLVMSAVADSIASGGDHVTFGSVVTVYGFDGGGAAGDSWTHPAAGVYVLAYDHAWDSYTGGGTVTVEVDGVLLPEGVVIDGTSGQSGHGVVIYHAVVGSVGRVHVDQVSGSAQTCSATLRVAISDPSASAGVPWERVFSADVWDATFDGSYWWTTDGAGATITKRDAIGTSLATFTASLNIARGITWDGADLWIAGDDTPNSAEEILRHATDGTLEATIVTGTGSDTNAGVAWDGTHLWLVEDGANRVEQYDTAGTLVSWFALAASGWAGLAIFDGDLFVIDGTTADLLRYTTAGSLVETIDISGASSTPTGVWIAADGSLYIAADGDGLYRRSAKIGA